MNLPLVFPLSSSEWNKSLGRVNFLREVSIIFTLVHSAKGLKECNLISEKVVRK